MPSEVSFRRPRPPGQHPDAETPHPRVIVTQTSFDAWARALIDRRAGTPGCPPVTERRP